MTGAAAAQELLPIGPDKALPSGVCPAQWYKGAIHGKIINSTHSIATDQIQPASIDLRLGKWAYRVPASFLPGKGTRIQEKVERLATEKIDLEAGAILERGAVYLIPLLENLQLKRRMSAIANAKSSTGRLDVFARVICDGGTEFDSIPEMYAGPLWAEVAPQSFRVVARTGSRLSQLRVRLGAPRQSLSLQRGLHSEQRLVADAQGQEPDIRREGIGFTVDLTGDPVSKLVGFKALHAEEPIDFDKINHYRVADFWQPIYRPASGGVILQTNEFHILASKETISVPEDLAAEMVSYDTLVGEFRVHYAGFFDPGFGHSTTGQGIAKAVLEVRSHEVPFLIEDGQRVGRLAYERLTEKTDKLYGQGVGSSYQFQGLALSKHFQR